MEIVERVITDIRRYYSGDYQRICCLASEHPSPNMGDMVCLNFNQDDVLTACVPMKRESRFQLEQYLKSLPESPEDHSDYPLNIIVWIRKHLLNESEKGSKTDPDVLGRYFYKHNLIEIYWLSICVCAENIEVQPLDLANVVRIHEWSHALVFQGRNEDGRKAISQPELMQTGISEGLAQFFTHHYIRQNFTSYSRYEGWESKSFVFFAYLKLLEGQSAAYRAHIDWLSFDLDSMYGEYEQFGLNKRKDLEEHILDDDFEEMDFQVEQGRQASPMAIIRKMMVVHLNEMPKMTVEQFYSCFIHTEIREGAALFRQSGLYSENSPDKRLHKEYFIKDFKSTL